MSAISSQEKKQMLQNLVCALFQKDVLRPSVIKVSTESRTRLGMVW